MALGHLTPGSRGRCLRPNDLEEEEEEKVKTFLGLFKANAVNEEREWETEGEGET